jgi:hypothetical protein
MKKSKKQKAWKHEQTLAEKGAAYLKIRGASCPHCGGSIEGSGMDFNGGEIIQKIACSDCHATWNDVYTLTAITTRDGKTIASIAIPAEESTNDVPAEKKNHGIESDAFDRATDNVLNAAESAMLPFLQYHSAAVLADRLITRLATHLRTELHYIRTGKSSDGLNEYTSAETFRAKFLSIGGKIR